MYKAPHVHKPSADAIKKLASEMGLDITQTDADEYKELMDHWLQSYEKVAELPEPVLNVKYPRLNPYKPSKQENPHNTWSYKVTIKGAPAGVLYGKSVAIKDCIPVAGVPMKNGTNMLNNYIPDYDATVVTRILDAGGVIKGTTNVEDMCFSGSSLTGVNGPVLNPYDTSRSAGGSSSGSAAAVAACDVDVAMGGDQGGSIRIPSSWCGTVGLKPTYGLVPFTGVAAIEMSVDHVGPIARNVTDCAALLQAIAGYDDGLDARQNPSIKCEDYLGSLTGDISGIRIGVLSEGFEGCDDCVVNVVRAAVQKLSTVACSVSEVSLPFHKDGVHIWSPVCFEGAYRTMFEYGCAGTGAKGFYPTGIAEHVTQSYATSKNDLSFVCKPTVLFCEYMKRNYRGRYYNKAANLMVELTRQYNKALETYDVLVMPTLPYVAPKLPAANTPTIDCVRHALGMIANTAVFNGTGHPALSINAGFVSTSSADGGSGGGGKDDQLPVGMMIVGKHFHDSTVLNVARAWEQIRDAGAAQQ